MAKILRATYPLAKVHSRQTDGRTNGRQPWQQLDR